MSEASACLSEAYALTAWLGSSLQEALANKQACHPNQPLRAPMPSHWTEMPQDAHVAYVELPLPAGCSPDPTGPAAQPTVPYLDEQILQAMMQQVRVHLHSWHSVNELIHNLSV